MPQYTIRNVPEFLDSELREVAKREGVSLNQAAIQAIKRGLGLTNAEPVYDDLDDLVGTWQKDDQFDQAIADQDQVDEELWK